jgi:hypothetical protein
MEFILTRRPERQRVGSSHSSVRNSSAIDPALEYYEFGWETTTRFRAGSIRTLQNHIRRLEGPSRLPIIIPRQRTILSGELSINKTVQSRTPSNARLISAPAASPFRIAADPASALQDRFISPAPLLHHRSVRNVSGSKCRTSDRFIPPSNTHPPPPKTPFPLTRSLN